MSAPPDRATARCACTNISLMQLFHELKQKFPAAPDHAVSAAISAYCHDKRACEQHLESHAAASLAHAYHASSSAAARKLKDLRTNLVPIECRNRPIEQHAVPVTSSVNAGTCDKPQNAQLSSSNTVDKNSNKINSEEETKLICISSQDGFFNAKNKNVIPTLQFTSDESPITINIDSCVVKSCETPSDAEAEDTTQRSSNESECNTNESTASNYRILKSHKIKSNLNERLEKPKCIGKKSIEPDINQKEEDASTEDTRLQKPKRPCTLEFIKLQPDVTITQQTIPEPEPCRTVSPAARPGPAPNERAKPAAPTTHWVEQSYPLNLSVNVNCHMGITNHPHTFYPNTWIEDYESPRAFTSVNLTVCTPTSGGMQSPVREVEAGDPRGFEGHVTVTVSPTRPPRRHAPAPPPRHSTASATSTTHHFLTTPTRDQAISENSLIVRQLARKQLLVAELARERERLDQVTRETAILAAPLPSPTVTHRLREQVERLRQQCQLLTRRLDSQNAQRAETDGFYNSYPTHQGRGVGVRESPVPTRPAPAPPTDDAPSWQCQICTFSNHGLLNKCEQCEMPRILLGTTDTTRSADSAIGTLTHETRIESSKLLGSSATPNQSEPACV